METNDIFCPNQKCECRGLRNQGNIVKASTYRCRGITRQMFKCSVCGKYFSETRNTIFSSSHYSEETIHSIIRCVSEGNGIEAAAKILGVSKYSVRRVMMLLGRQWETARNGLLKDLHLKESQIDELWSFISNSKMRERGPQKNKRGSRQQ